MTISTYSSSSSSLDDQPGQSKWLCTTFINPTDVKIRLLKEGVLSLDRLDEGKVQLFNSVKSARSFVKTQDNSWGNFWYQYIVEVAEKTFISLDKIGFLDSNDPQFTTDIMEILTEENLEELRKNKESKSKLIKSFTLGPKLMEEINVYRSMDPNFLERQEEYLQSSLDYQFRLLSEQINPSCSTNQKILQIQKRSLLPEKANLILLNWFDELIDLLLEDIPCGINHLLTHRNWMLSEIIKNLRVDREFSTLTPKCAPTTLSSLELLLNILHTLHSQGHLKNCEVIKFLLPVSHEQNIGSIIPNFFYTSSITVPYVSLLVALFNNEYLSPKLYMIMDKLDFDTYTTEIFKLNVSFLKRLKITIDDMKYLWKRDNDLILFKNLRPLFHVLQTYKEEKPNQSMWKTVKIRLDNRKTSLQDVLKKFQKLERKVAKRENFSSSTPVNIPNLVQLKEEIPTLIEKYHRRLQCCKEENLLRQQENAIRAQQRLEFLERKIRELEEALKRENKVGVSDFLIGGLSTMFSQAASTNMERSIHYAKEEYRKELEALQDNLERETRWNTGAPLFQFTFPSDLKKTDKSSPFNSPLLGQHKFRSDSQYWQDSKQRLKNLENNNEAAEATDAHSWESLEQRLEELRNNHASSDPIHYQSVEELEQRLKRLRNNNDSCESIDSLP